MISSSKSKCNKLNPIKPCIYAVFLFKISVKHT
nr:MAG TPA: hypothetical protein [Caudoviricetes sp.]